MSNYRARDLITVGIICILCTHTSVDSDDMAGGHLSKCRNTKCTRGGRGGWKEFGENKKRRAMTIIEEPEAADRHLRMFTTRRRCSRACKSVRRRLHYTAVYNIASVPGEPPPRIIILLLNARGPTTTGVLGENARMIMYTDVSEFARFFTSSSSGQMTSGGPNETNAILFVKH